METERARELLTAERERLSQLIAREGAAGGGEEAANDLLAADSQPADAAQETINRELVTTVVGSLQDELDEVERALTKLEEGTYGLDESTGEPIPDERLEVRPMARFTVANEAQQEKLAKANRGLDDESRIQGGASSP